MSLDNKTTDELITEIEQRVEKLLELHGLDTISEHVGVSFSYVQEVIADIRTLTDTNTGE